MKTEKTRQRIWSYRDLVLFPNDPFPSLETRVMSSLHTNTAVRFPDLLQKERSREETRRQKMVETIVALKSCCAVKMSGTRGETSPRSIVCVCDWVGARASVWSKAGVDLYE